MTLPISSPDLAPVISAKAIAKSGRVLKAFTLLYLPFHGLEPSDLFDIYGPVAFVSASVYQADELNENGYKAGAPSLDTLRNFLARSGFLDDRISKHLDEGEQYLAFERSLRNGRHCDFQEIVTAMRWRSSDFRILHCLLHQFLNKTYEQDVFDAYAAFEMMMEVDDDIGSYKDDIKANTFNFLRALLSVPDSKKAAEQFRLNVLSEIAKHNQSLPPTAARKFEAILTTYKKLVPGPQIPKDFALNGDRV